MDIAKIDRNFAVNDVHEENGGYQSIDQPPFAIYGVMKDEKGYCRVPAEVARRTSEGVEMLNRHTAGGIIRFATDSPSITLKAENPINVSIMSHMTVAGVCGFEVFSGTHFMGTFVPQMPIEGFTQKKILYTEKTPVDEDGFRDITIYMPLYGGYRDIFIKVEEGCHIRPGKTFRNEKPVVFYGHSITQGGCASSPAKAYTNMVSRSMDLYHINLGFSGSGKGEPAMAEYIAGLDMAALVMDYDFNAPTPEYLEATHRPFFEIIRKKNPDLPVLFATTSPKFLGAMSGEAIKRRQKIVYTTYQAALAAGDKNVYYLNCEEIFGEEIDFSECTVEGSHPNDIGMLIMKKGFEQKLREMGI